MAGGGAAVAEGAVRLDIECGKAHAQGFGDDECATARCDHCPVGKMHIGRGNLDVAVRIDPHQCGGWVIGQDLLWTVDFDAGVQVEAEIANPGAPAVKRGPAARA